MTHSEIKSDDDFMFTHTYIDSEHFGARIPFIRVFGETDPKVLRRMGQLFRILDDDGNIYFSGYAAEESFEPLDYAGPRWGCTDIQYRDGETNEWTSL